MTYDGPAFYDDDEVFKTYQEKRSRSDTPNDTLEKPVILELAGDLANQRILDLGCGDAAFGRYALSQGCQAYVGIEGSHKMAAVAQQQLAGTIGMVAQAALEEWEYPPEAFDLAISRLVFHYIQDIETVFRQAHRTLVKGGRLVFSVEHPVITSSDKGWQRSGPRQNWVVDNYFITGPRVTSWMGSQVIKYHRTVEGYFLALQREGFIVESVRESDPRRECFENEALYLRRQRIPLFLFMAGKKC
jgi:SAM-dependent methyltransferase